jgi:hypothetical protein
MTAPATGVQNHRPCTSQLQVISMAHSPPRRLPLIIATGLLVASCSKDGSSPPAETAFTADIRAIGDAIATVAKYPPGEFELTSSALRLRISVADAKLATADAGTRTSEAAGIVAAAEQILASHPEYAKLEAISVAIIHPTSDDASHKEWHTEDVIEFRKGPNQRFTMHIT